MKKEYMCYIRNAGDAKSALSAQDHLRFIRQCEEYIAKLKAGGHLVAAQPLLREGCFLSKEGRGWSIQELDTSQEVQVGYYHLQARSLEEAIGLAKENPEFAFVPSASIEIRPVKTKEVQTNFIYPK